MSTAMPIKIVDLSSLRQYSHNSAVSLPVFSDPGHSRILCLEPGQEWRSRTDGHQLVYIVLDGQAELTAGGKQRQLGVSVMAMVEPGTDHILRNNRDDRFAVLQIETKP
jgi:quercetin dioxygenase-like cupin family protein